jgi:hypothetical protein
MRVINQRKSVLGCPILYDPHWWRGSRLATSPTGPSAFPSCLIGQRAQTRKTHNEHLETSVWLKGKLPRGRGGKARRWSCALEMEGQGGLLSIYLDQPVLEKIHIFSTEVVEPCVQTPRCIWGGSRRSLALTCHNVVPPTSKFNYKSQ